MTVTEPKTRSVFDRYHIVSPKDLQEASRRLVEITPAITDRAQGNPARRGRGIVVAAGGLEPPTRGL